MGLLGFFGFGHSDDNAVVAMHAAQKASQSLNIEVSIAAHENWLTRLETYLAGRSHEELEPAAIACDETCELGHWIYTDGKKYLGNYAAFQDLQASHKMFHFKASSIVSLHQANHKEEAEKELAGDIQKLSHKISQRLRDLKAIG
jgi:hypothetical protein